MRQPQKQVVFKMLDHRIVGTATRSLATFVGPPFAWVVERVLTVLVNATKGMQESTAKYINHVNLEW